LRSGIPEVLRRHVIGRARSHCEYCGLSQQGQEATFHIDHVVPVRAGGQTLGENLALACVACSLHKAARRSAVDPATGREAEIFNPRRQRWQEHFRWQELRVLGITATGRATVEALQMNRPIALAIRAEEIPFGRHPPPT